MPGVVTNWGEAIFTALTTALNLLLAFIPKLLGFLVILLVGWIIATAISKALTFLLRKVGFDRMANRIGLTRLEQRMGIQLDPAGVLGQIAYWFIFLIFLVPATDALGLSAVSNILNTLVAYIPNVFVAILVLFLGTLAATFVADIVRGATASANVGNPRVFANIARYAIIAFAALVALEQLQIAPALLNELFGGIVLAAAIAFGLAFGLGGQDTARRWLARSENTMTTMASQVSNNPQNMSVDQMRAQQMQAGQQQYEQMRAQQAAQQRNANAYQPASDDTPTQQTMNRPDIR
jgi:flagellar biosynthesis protein FliQ